MEESISELEKYQQIPADPDTDVLEFWKKLQQQNDFNALCSIARWIHALPATSASCERIFRYGGLIVTPIRSRIQPRNVARLLKIQQNLKFMEEEEIDIVGKISVQLPTYQPRSQ